MTAFGEDLILSLGEALAHVKGEGSAVVHAPLNPREVRKHAGLTQAETVLLMSLANGNRVSASAARPRCCCA